VRHTVEVHVALQVLAAASEPGAADLRTGQEERDPGVAGAVRLEQRQVVGRGQGEVVAAGDGVDHGHAAQVVGAEGRLSVGLEGAAKARDVVAPQTESAGGAMAAEAQERLGAGLDGGQQVERRDAASRSFGRLVALGEQDGGPVQPVGHACRHDADDTFVPVGGREHQRRRNGIGDHGHGFA
jgi:hypothetical protein